MISTVAGNLIYGFSGDSGPATAAAELSYPYQAGGLTPPGIRYIADTYNQRIRKVSAAGIINTVAGKSAAGFSGDGGPATAAELNLPFGTAVDANGNIFIAEYGNQSPPQGLGCRNYQYRRGKRDGGASVATGDWLSQQS